MGKLEDIADKMNQKYGESSVSKLSEVNMNVETFSSDSIALDDALGGGYPVGRIIEIYGPESSGKTTLAIHAIKVNQMLGKETAFIDVEHAFDPEYAASIGVDTDKMYISQPTTGEEALDIAEAFCEGDNMGLIVIDSVSALVPKAELEGDIGDSKIGLQARLMSQAMRMLKGKANQNGTTIIFINQIRMKIGVMFGSPETTSGGNALKFYASQRLDVRRIGQVKTGEEVSANRTRVTVKKNKVAPPFKKSEFEIEFGVGIDIIREVIEIGSEMGIIKKSGSWYSYGDTKLGQGVPAVKALLTDNPELLEEIKDKFYVEA